MATALTLIVAVVAAYFQYRALDDERLAAVRADQASRYSDVYNAMLDVDKNLAEHPDFLSCLEATGCSPSPTPQQKSTREQLGYYLLNFSMCTNRATTWV